MTRTSKKPAFDQVTTLIHPLSRIDKKLCCPQGKLQLYFQLALLLTHQTMPYIMTGQVYKNEQPYDAYIEEACKNTDYYHKLRDEGFDIGFYTTGL